jgi:hypothetical protein
MNYYCLIAGLPDLHVEDTKTISPLLSLKEEMMSEASSLDAKFIQLIFTSYDNANFLSFVKNNEVTFNPLGNLNSDDFKNLFSLFHEDPKIVKKHRVPLYIQQFYLNTISETFSFEGVSHEDYLAGLYYEYAMKCKNEFLRNWFVFNLNVNNLLTALACRKHGFNHKSMIVGNNEVANIIRQSNARDFGLAGMFAEYELVNRIAEENDLLEREKKIDALKWNWLDENTFFKYFSIEKILVYILKIQMLERWKLLSIEKGTEIFRNMVGELKKGISFENTK